MPTSDNIYANTEYQYQPTYDQQQAELDEEERRKAEELKAQQQAAVEAAKVPEPSAPTSTPQAPQAPTEVPESDMEEKVEQPEQNEENSGNLYTDVLKEGGKFLAGKFVKDNQAGVSAGLGVGDILADTVGLLPWLKPADEWWEEKSGRNLTDYDPVQKAIRDTASNLIPFLTFSGPVVGTLSKAGQVSKLPKLTKGADAVAKGAAYLGLSAGISVVNDTTKEPGNLGTAMEKMFGIDVPWATRDGDSPDWIFAMNMLENTLIDGAGELFTILTGIKATKGSNKIIPADEVSATKIKPQVDRTPEEAMIAERQLSDTAANEEAMRRYEADPEGVNGYDSFVNEPAEPQKRVIQFKEGDIVNFKADNDRIINNVGTNNGRARPAVTTHFQEKFLAATESVDVEDLVNQVTSDLDINFHNVIGDVTRSSDEINQSIDILTARVFNDEANDFVSNIDQLKFDGEKILGNEVKRLTQDGFTDLSNAMTQAIEILNPGKRKARAVLSSQAGGGLVDTSRAIQLIGTTADTARQQENAWTNLGVLMKTVRDQQYIDGFSLNFKKLVAENPGQVTAEWLNQQNEAYKVTLKNKGVQTLEFINTLKDVSKENPEYFKPLFEQFMKTKGDVDSLYKLGALIDNRLGFWKKAFIDGQPDYPSLLVQELSGARYNFLLNGKAPINAFGGLVLGLGGKPISQMAGWMSEGKFKEMGEAFKTFSAVGETFSRGIKYGAQEWRYALDNPTGAAARSGRKDIALQPMEDFEMLEQLSDSWYKEGKFGKVAAWNSLKLLTVFSRSNWNRWGINSMSFLDGFVKSANTSLIARQRAMDEVFAKGGAWDEAMYKAKQQELYDKSFDKNGVLTDEAAKYASGEVNLNLDNKLTSALDTTLKYVPAAKSLFLFARTGINAQTLNATFNPLGPLGLGIGRAGKVQRAKLNSPEAAEALMEHGYAPDDMQALKRLQMEYKGRAMMGQSLVFGAGLMAFSGNLTGSGPANDAMRRDMMNNGWKPFHIKIGDNWHSYANMGPISLFLGLVSDVVYESTQRPDQAYAEDMFRTIAHSITMNITNATFLSGFEPLAAAIGGDQGSWNRLLAKTGDQYIIGAGARSLLNKIVVPQLKDVQDNFAGHMANRNRFLPPVNEELADQVDIYTGERINYMNPINATINALLPFGQTNGGIEPWRERLLQSGWTGQKRNRLNPDTQEPFTPEQRKTMNVWIAKNSGLGEQLMTLFGEPDNWGNREIKAFMKERGTAPKSLMDIDKTALYEHLDNIHNQAYKDAFEALKQQDQSMADKILLKQATNDALQRSDFKGAKELSDRFLQQSLK